MARAIEGGVFRVVLADDVAMFKLIVRFLLDTDDRFEIVAEVSDGAEAIRACSASRPDLILLDLGMPVLSGVEAIPAIRACSPQTSIVVFSAFKRDHVDADAYIEKDSPISEIAPTIHAVATAARNGAPIAA